MLNNINTANKSPAFGDLRIQTHCKDCKEELKSIVNEENFPDFSFNSFSQPGYVFMRSKDQNSLKTYKKEQDAAYFIKTKMQNSDSCGKCTKNSFCDRIAIDQLDRNNPSNRPNIPNEWVSFI